MTETVALAIDRTSALAFKQYKVVDKKIKNIEMLTVSYVTFIARTT